MYSFYFNFFMRKKIKFVWKRSTNYWLKVVFKSTINNEPITRSITAVKRKEEIWIDLQLCFFKALMPFAIDLVQGKSYQVQRK